ncbi:MAG TPA: metal ABC transporter permease [Thermodesulfobacteriota bacterium]
MDALVFLWPALAAGLVLAGIHAYLGLHVLVRGVIFVDLALAQAAALGAAVATLAGHPSQGATTFGYSLAFALGGAGLLALSRQRHPRVPQEALIGVVYVVAAALVVLVLDRSPEGAERVKGLLLGDIVTIDAAHVGTLALLYAAVGAILAEGVGRRLAIGWTVGEAGAVAGLGASLAFDLPTGAAIVSLLGLALLGVLAARAALGPRGRRRESLARAGRVVVAGGGIALAAAGAGLAAFPAWSYGWLTLIERALPLVETAFLTPAERQVREDTLRTAAWNEAEVARLAAVREAVRFGARTMDAEAEDRLRQYLLARQEIAAGDRFVLAALRGRARARQRFVVGVPLVVGGVALALWSVRQRYGSGRAGLVPHSKARIS